MSPFENQGKCKNYERILTDMLKILKNKHDNSEKKI